MYISECSKYINIYIAQILHLIYMYILKKKQKSIWFDVTIKYDYKQLYKNFKD